MKFKNISLKPFLRRMLECAVWPVERVKPTNEKFYAEKCRCRVWNHRPKVQAKIMKLEFHFNELWPYNSASYIYLIEKRSFKFEIHYSTICGKFSIMLINTPGCGAYQTFFLRLECLGQARRQLRYFWAHHPLPPAIMAIYLSLSLSLAIPQHFII